GDNGYIDEDGYVFILNRSDDVINVAGHRLSTGLMEEVVATHPQVAECAVVGVADAVKGQMPVGLLVLKSGCDPDPKTLEGEVVALVRAKVGPVASFKHALMIKRLPKTRSGKILRKTIRQIADGSDWTMPATIEDASALDEVERVLGAVMTTS
ncbi:MAG: propionyl-CoA synthetase, partial [Marivita sp.]